MPPRVPATEQAIKRFRENMEDLAIIKLDTVPKELKCLRLRRDPLPDGSVVFHTGFPSRLDDPVFAGSKELQQLKFRSQCSERAAEFQDLATKLEGLLAATSDERWNLEGRFPMYLSLGRAFKDYRTAEESFRYFSDRARIRMFDQLSDPTIYSVSTAPVGPGFSGGGTFDIYGQIAGVTVMSSGNDLKAGPYGYGLSFVRSDHIYRRVSEQFGTLMADEIFSCPE